MTKKCPVCDIEFLNGDSVVACMLTKYRAIDSGVTFALTHPERCLDLVHEECFDDDGPIDDEGAEDNDDN